jgi:Tfp pilus assembly protein PilF
MIFSRHLCMAALLAALGACATPVERPLEAVVPVFGDSARFGARPGILAPEDLHRLTPAQQAHFLAYFNDPSRAGIPAFRRLYAYLETMVQDFQYQGDTLPASEALARQTGNCLSLAMLTTALAQVAGVEIGYQMMEDQPVFEYQGNTVRKGVHVSTILYNPEWLAAERNTMAQFAISKGYRIDYFPSLRGRFVANLDYSEYLALYYSNMASDAILAQDYATAYWYLDEALAQDPDHSASLNMLAVVHRRVGDVATAEAIYRYGISHAKDKLSLLKNYHRLLVNEGRAAEAAQVQAQLDTMDDPSPYHWLQLARESHVAGDWDGAIGYYRRALALGPYMHEAHLGLAQSYYAAGRLRNAERALIDAAELANRASTRTLYEAKLASLRREF